MLRRGSGAYSRARGPLFAPLALQAYFQRLHLPLSTTSMEDVGLANCAVWSNRTAARRRLAQERDPGVKRDSLAFLALTAALRRADNDTTTWTAHYQTYDAALRAFVAATSMSMRRFRRCVAAAGLSLLDGKCYGDRLPTHLQRPVNRVSLADVKQARAHYLKKCLVRVFT